MGLWILIFMRRGWGINSLAFVLLKIHANMELTSNQQFGLLALVIMGVLYLISKAMTHAEKKAEREYFKDMVDRGYEIMNEDEDEEDDKD